ncbi:hypothetical protein OXYTRIMIC_378 [Oxytricha trifallax]|uniref:Ubiquitin-like protease family profile domain-containing protein n=1 Tax=Oxytricha trifallax TaxID=1172189 RepID=A0A073HYT1_9SPIT|nr:hypothetical protein OXYTRIMIC_378 [Oxytricha trifallax]
MKDTRRVDVYDIRKQVGALALLQRHLTQFNNQIGQTIGKRAYAERNFLSKPEINQVKAEDCGILAILMANYLALELPGEAVFQIFAKYWINMQRYYLMFNLEVGP